MWLGLFEILLNNLLSVSKSKAQMVVPRGILGTTLLATLLVTLFLMIAEGSCALLWSLLFQAYFGLGYRL